MSSPPDDGIIKYKLSLKMTPPLASEEYLDLEKWRAILYRMGLIGEYPNTNVGFGNLSKRIMASNDQFIITGSQTGRYPNLNGRQYTKVLKCNLSKATIDAMGPIAPSSESMTHYNIYHKCPHIQYVFHVHHLPMWELLCNQPGKYTGLQIPYGTPEMAKEVIAIVGNTSSGILAMGGHREGVISWGETSEQAGKILLDTLKKIQKP